MRDGRPVRFHERELVTNSSSVSSSSVSSLSSVSLPPVVVSKRMRGCCGCSKKSNNEGVMDECDRCGDDCCPGCLERAHEFWPDEDLGWDYYVCPLCAGGIRGGPGELGVQTNEAGDIISVTSADGAHTLQMTQERSSLPPEEEKTRDTCPICQEELLVERTATLPCSHKFCDECVAQWFLNLDNNDANRTCPYCRTECVYYFASSLFWEKKKQDGDEKKLQEMKAAFEMLSRNYRVLIDVANRKDQEIRALNGKIIQLTRNQRPETPIIRRAEQIIHRSFDPTDPVQRRIMSDMYDQQTLRTRGNDQSVAAVTGIRRPSGVPR